MVKRVCVFCGSSSGSDGVYLEEARLLARTLADAGLELVYGGGGTGLMRALAETFQACGGHTVGVVPNAFLNTENVFEALSERHVVGSYHERKMLMYHLSDAFVALPGGPGTLEELVEHLTWMRRAVVDKPVYLVNVYGYWNALLRLFEDMRTAGFISDHLTDRCGVFESSALAVNALVGRLRCEGGISSSHDEEGGAGSSASTRHTLSDGARGHGREPSAGEPPAAERKLDRMNSVIRRSRGRPVVRLAPEEWGFGPLGNALHLARVIRTMAADAVNLEIVVSDTFRGPLTEGLFDCVHPDMASADRADAVVTVMNVNGVVAAAERNEKVYVVDALAWLWTEPLPIQHLIHAYFYQDLAVLPVPRRNLAEMPNATPISAIGTLPSVLDDSPSDDPQASLVVSLSGLETPASRSGTDILWYPPYVLDAFEHLAKTGRIDPDDLALFGNADVIERFAGPNIKRAVRRNASQSAFARAARAAGSIVCSPGLTTIVECLRAGIGLKLLPAQNFGQLKQMNAFVHAIGTPAMPWTGASANWLPTATLPAEVRTAIMRGILAEARLVGKHADPDKLLTMLQQPAPIPALATVERLVGADDGAFTVAQRVLEDVL